MSEARAPKEVIYCPYDNKIWWGDDGFSETDCEEYGYQNIDENGEDLEEPQDGWCHALDKPCSARRYKLIPCKEAADAVRDEDK